MVVFDITGPLLVAFVEAAVLGVSNRSRLASQGRNCLFLGEKYVFYFLFHDLHIDSIITVKRC